MPKTNVGPAKRTVRWSDGAQRSLGQSMAYIEAQDVAAAQRVLQRLQAALDLIAIQPDIGTLIKKRSARRFPIPKTGHTIEYLVWQGEIFVTRWARQRRKS